MSLLDKVKIFYNGQCKYIELHTGDVTGISKDLHFDALVMSSYPNDYIATPGSLLETLLRKNLSVSYLASTKEFDLLDSDCCWVSSLIDKQECQVGFNRIFCFEPLRKNVTLNQSIATLFTILTRFARQEKLRAIGIPITYSGILRFPLKGILYPLLENAAKWLSIGLEIDAIRLIVNDQKQIAEATGILRNFKSKYDNYIYKFNSEFEFDYFISYSHSDFNFAKQLMKSLGSDKKIYIDEEQLKIGTLWQENIFLRLDNCKTILSLITPSYLASPYCMFEFNVGLYRTLNSNQTVIKPIYMQSGSMPSYMKQIQYVDCREGDIDKLNSASKLV